MAIKHTAPTGSSTGSRPQQRPANPSTPAKLHPQALHAPKVQPVGKVTGPSPAAVAQAIASAKKTIAAGHQAVTAGQKALKSKAPNAQKIGQTAITKGNAAIAAGTAALKQAQALSPSTKVSGFDLIGYAIVGQFHQGQLSGNAAASLTDLSQILQDTINATNDANNLTGTGTPAAQVQALVQQLKTAFNAANDAAVQNDITTGNALIARAAAPTAANDAALPTDTATWITKATADYTALTGLAPSLPAVTNTNGTASSATQIQTLLTQLQSAVSSSQSSGQYNYALGPAQNDITTGQALLTRAQAPTAATDTSLPSAVSAWVTQATNDYTALTGAPPISASGTPLSQIQSTLSTLQSSLSQAQNASMMAQQSGSPPPSTYAVQNDITTGNALLARAQATTAATDTGLPTAVTTWVSQAVSDNTTLTNAIQQMNSMAQQQQGGGFGGGGGGGDSGGGGGDDGSGGGDDGSGGGDDGSGGGGYGGDDGSGASDYAYGGGDDGSDDGSDGSDSDDGSDDSDDPDDPTNDISGLTLLGASPARVLMIRVKNPGQLAAKQGGTAGGVAAYLVPDTVADQVLQAMKTQLKQKMTEQGVDCDVEIVNDTNPAVAGPKSDLKGGLLLGALGVVLTGGALWTGQHFIRKLL